jgi:hypothetical protein
VETRGDTKLPQRSSIAETRPLNGKENDAAGTFTVLYKLAKSNARNFFSGQRHCFFAKILAGLYELTSA